MVPESRLRYTTQAGTGSWRDGDGALSCSTGPRAQEGGLGNRRDVPCMARCHRGKAWTGRAGLVARQDLSELERWK